MNKQNRFKGMILLLVSVLPFMSMRLEKPLFMAEDPTICPSDFSAWIGFSNTGGTLSTGNYILNDNINLINNITISGTSNVKINLNGYILKGANGSNASIFTVTGGTLSIYDCPSTQRVHPYKIKTVGLNSTQDYMADNLSYSNKLFQRYYDFNDIGDGVIVGGIITGGHKYATNTDLRTNFDLPGGGSAFLIGGSNAVVNFYGGTISGNTTTILSKWAGGHYERSGAVGVKGGGTFNFYDGQITGNSSRYQGAAIYVYGYSGGAARANIYGGVIHDNYALNDTHQYLDKSTLNTPAGAVSSDNVSAGSSIISIMGSPIITDNYGYRFTQNDYIKTNMSFSNQTSNAIQILGKLYTEENGMKTYAKIGLWGGNDEGNLTKNYTFNGNTHEEVNRIFFADDTTKAVGYDTLSGELKYVVSNLKTLTYDANDGSLETETISVVDKISVRDVSFDRQGYTFSHWNTEPNNSGTIYEQDDILTLTANVTLYAIWDLGTYRIEYWTNGGTLDGEEPTEYTYNDELSLPMPVWTGKTFEGWYDNPLLSGSPITQMDPFDYGDKTYYAKWFGVNGYVITSNAGANGSISPSGSIIYDGIRQIYQITPNSGYKIESVLVGGVNHTLDVNNHEYTITDVVSDTTIDVTFSEILDTDIVVYATTGEHGDISPKGFSVVPLGSSITYQFTPQPGYRVNQVTVNGSSVGVVSSYTLSNITTDQTIQVTYVLMVNSAVQFVLNGATFVSPYVAPSTYIEGIGADLPTASQMSFEHYTFMGWYDNGYFEGTPLTKIPLNQTGDIIYHAKFVISQYTIDFEENGGSTVNSMTGDYNTAISTPDNPTKEGHTFIGWYSDESLETPYTIVTIPGENIMLYAKWSAYSYTITFDSNGGSAIINMTQDYGATIIAPANPTKVGYTFTGWSEAMPATMPAENLELVASWTINSYTLSFDTDGGVVIPSITQNYGTSITAPLNPTKVGYTFAGWSSAIPNTMPAENLELVASWTINSYTLSFDTDGGVVIPSITQNYGTAITAPLNPTKVGYTFAGWSSAIPNTMPAENLELVASWTINSYTLSFDTDGGVVIPSITQNYGTSITAPLNPTKVGYTFAGWSSAIPNTMPAENLELVASWTINSYTLSFDTNGGVVIPSITQNYGTAITAPSNPTKVGYTFAGWSEAIPATMPAENLELVASWTINSYTISFDTDGGTVISDITQNYGTAITAPSNPTKVGYTFAGWSEAIPATMPAENLELVASWMINSYTLSFDTDGGVVIPSITQNYGTSITAPLNPTKVGYTFAGWSVAIPASVPAEDLTLVASWTVNEYTIIFNSNGGSAVSNITQDYGTVITAPGNPTRSGYVFNGWSTTIPSDMPAEDLELTATWIIVVKPVLPGIDYDSSDLLDAIESELIENKDIEVSIEFDILTDTNISRPVLDLIGDTLESNQLYTVIYIRVVIKTQGSPDTLVTELEKPVSVIVTIPEAERGYRNYQIVRMHNGNMEILVSVYDKENHTLTFETDQFSHYVLVYDQLPKANWGWWFLLLLIPAGFALYYYRKPLFEVLQKGRK